MVVDAFGVEMGADHRLKVPAEQPIRKFQPDLVGQFRRYLSGSKALHQMEALHTFFLVPGYGAQGATGKDLRGCFDANGRGAVVNASRSILTAWKKQPGVDFAQAARNEAIRMRDDIMEGM